MAQQGRSEPPEYNETVAPENPPNSVVNPQVRKTALWTYLGPIAALCIVFGLALIFVANRNGGTPTDDFSNTAVGTSGTETPGGFDPSDRPARTRDELEERGADELPQGPMPALRSEISGLEALTSGEPNELYGRRVDARAVEVESVNGRTLWVRDGDARIAVVAPAGAPDVQPGTRIDVTGTAERGDDGGVRVRATHIGVSR